MEKLNKIPSNMQIFFKILIQNFDKTHQKLISHFFVLYFNSPKYYWLCDLICELTINIQTSEWAADWRKFVITVYMYGFN